MRRLPAAEIVRLATAPLRKGVTVDLTELAIDEPIDLSGRALGNVDFSGSVFSAPLICTATVLAGLAWFKRARFESALDMSQAVFANDLRMKAAEVAGPARFSRAEFRGVAEFDQVTFHDRVDLDGLVAFGNMSMDGTVFSAPVTLQGSDFLGGLWCERAVFAARSDFRGVEVHGRTWLKGVSLPTRETANARRNLRDIQSFGYRWI